MSAPTAARSRGPATRPVEITLKDLHGVARQPMALGDAKASVIIFISVDCPVSNAYAPEINRICKQYKGKINFYLVHCDPELTAEQAQKHADAYGFTCPVLLDGHHLLAKALGARVESEAAVVGPEGKLEYRGRIDDWYYAIGKHRNTATTHDLRDALDAVIAGRSVTTSRKKAVGCALDDE